MYLTERQKKSIEWLSREFGMIHAARDGYVFREGITDLTLERKVKEMEEMLLNELVEHREENGNGFLNE
ncbi:hypothetical protein HOB25_00035 [bacterium]|jgi:hypothetical protein|nr:hypothetical protein [Candidatus Neomarinimicrobiota bacterium]MBT6454115.1 hypothetical protein [Gammaproteobacteria bacterium]MBT6753360.1 hypothetical protein [bacterium]